MKSLLLLLTSPITAICALAGIQTIEWSFAERAPVPICAYLLIAITILWCILAGTVNTQEMQKALQLMENWLNKLFNLKKN